jgi:hypothetical protein
MTRNSRIRAPVPVAVRSEIRALLALSLQSPASEKAEANNCLSPDGLRH